MTRLFKDDGTEWYNYFFIRRDDYCNYYFAWIGTKRPVWPDESWRSVENMRNWIITANWKSKVDEEFEKEVLCGPEDS